MLGAVSGGYRPESSRYTGDSRFAGYTQSGGQAAGPLSANAPPPGTGLADLQRATQAQQKDKDGSAKNNGAEKYRCQTCEERTYQDGSNDPGVSMKTPTKVSPQNAAAAVMGHEQEHVTRNAFKAQAQGREVLSSSVTIHSAICPECGRTYVSGGTTRTVTGERQEKNRQQEQTGQPARRLDRRV